MRSGAQTRAFVLRTIIYKCCAFINTHHADDNDDVCAQMCATLIARTYCKRGGVSCVVL